MPRKRLPNVAIPSNSLEATNWISRFRDAKRAIEQKTLVANRRIARIQADLALETASFQGELEELGQGLHLYATAHRPVLTDGGRMQSAEFGTGRLGWKTGPPRTEIRQSEKVVKFLEDHDFEDFLRIKKEINREAMLADPERAETVPGVTIVQDEFFYIKPDDFDTEIEIAKSKLRRRTR